MTRDTHNIIEYMKDFAVNRRLEEMSIEDREAFLLEARKLAYMGNEFIKLFTPKAN